MVVTSATDVAGTRRFANWLVFAIGFVAGVVALFGVALLAALRNL
jgi:allophanate hydrolase subunit 1